MKILDKKIVFNLALVVLIVGSIVFTLGFGICLYIARQEVTKEANAKMQRDVAFVQNYMDGQLQRVEDVAYTVASSKFGASKRNADGKGFVSIDPKTFTLPSEEEVFMLLEQFLDANPQICGVAIGFEPSVYPNTKGEYGFAAYVTNVSGKKERLRLGEMHDYRQKEWYHEAAASNEAYWSRPFRETSMQKVVTCFSLPLHGYNNRLVGVLACDINTDNFRKECNAISPYPNAEVTVVDREFRFVCHSDTSLLLKRVNEVDTYKSYKTDDSMRIKMENLQSGNYLVNEGTNKEAFFHFCPIKRTGWTVSIECPSSEIYSGVERMKRDTTLIAIGSILVMLVCFIWFFRHLQKITISKASIESELSVAAKVQMGLVPKIYPAFPENKDLDVYGFIKPAKSIGGDLYDYFIRDDKLFFCIGDVSGKGIPASLFMTVIIALLRNVGQNLDKPADIIRSINNTISKNNEYCMFCTMFVGVLDLKTGHLDYCNGGHNSPIMRRVMENGEVKVDMMNTNTNISVGMMEDMDFIGEETQLSHGDAIFLYTDGVTEAENIDHQQFGEENTLKSLANARKNGARTAKDFIESVYRSVAKYAGEAEQSDDITMLVVEYK